MLPFHSLVLGLLETAVIDIIVNTLTQGMEPMRLQKLTASQRGLGEQERLGEPSSFPILRFFASLGTSASLKGEYSKKKL